MSDIKGPTKNIGTVYQGPQMFTVYACAPLDPTPGSVSLWVSSDVGYQSMRFDKPREIAALLIAAADWNDQQGGESPAKVEPPNAPNLVPSMLSALRLASAEIRRLSPPGYIPPVLGRIHAAMDDAKGAA